MPTRTLLRSRQIRADLATLDTDRDEEKLLRGRYFEADCLAADAVEDLVYIRANKSGGFFQVEKVDIQAPATMPAIGMILEKSTSTRCFVQVFGIIELSGLVVGDRYWVGADSQIAASPPTRVVGVQVIAQVVGVALSGTELLFNPDYQAVKLRAL
ncbi:MAG TPA: hypothetical protein VMW52_08775 [Phycisphaerae bacterium]|nr:hypothetical protein [Phycisphaerae bacterium]